MVRDTVLMSTPSGRFMRTSVTGFTLTNSSTEQ
jgi:hypothetical protein